MKNEPLVEARMQLGMMSKEVAKALGINEILYNFYESMYRYPNEKRQKDICDFFRKRGVFLFEEDVFPESMKEIEPLRSQYRQKKKLPIKLFSNCSSQEFPYSEDISTIVESKELRDFVNKAILSLTKREQQIMCALYGLTLENRAYGPQKVADALGITRQRVLQIKDNAIEKLKGPVYSKRLNQFVDYKLREFVA